MLKGYLYFTIQARNQDFEMRGEFSPPQSEKSKERRGLRKKGGG